MSERITEHQRGFASGICVACAILADAGGDSYAEEILAAVGLKTRAACKRVGVDKYDLDRLQRIFGYLNP